VQQRKDSTVAEAFDRHGRLALIIEGDLWARVVVSLKLSSRERQIVECMLAGVDSEVLIGERLGMSSRTVHTHLERLYRKLSVTSRSQLLAYLFVAYASHPDTADY
jgi:DNA-binding CsgD family transcriptional regulator